MTPKTQSVCPESPTKQHTFIEGECSYCGVPKPVAEPASTGEPGTGFYRSASLQESIAQDEIERAARPSEPSAPHTSAEPQPLPCRTPGAVYHFKLAHSEQSRREILTLHVYLPQEISIVEEQAQAIEEKLHDACEAILSTYWPDTFAAAPQPVSGDAPTCKFICAGGSVCGVIEEFHKFGLGMHKFVETSPFIPAGDAPKVEEIARQIAEKLVAHHLSVWQGLEKAIELYIELIIPFLRPYFPPASQNVDADMLAALKEQYRLQNIVGLDRAFRRKMQARANNMMREAIAKAEKLVATPASTAPQIDWQKWYQKTADFVGGIRKELGLPDGDTHAIDHLIVIRDLLKKRGLIPPPASTARTDRDLRQIEVAEWCAAAFGADQCSLPMRGLRMLEEAIEAYQSATIGLPTEEMKAKAHALVDYVMNRLAGNLAQECGGVGLTLLALCQAAGISAEAEELREIARVKSKLTKGNSPCVV